jgi:hypothetical protein
LKSVTEWITNLPKNIYFDFLNLELGNNVKFIIEIKETKEFIKTLSNIKGVTSNKVSSTVNYFEIERLLDDLSISVDEFLNTKMFKKDTEPSCLDISEIKKGHYMEELLNTNIRKYKFLLLEIRASLTILLATLRGLLRLDKISNHILSEIADNQVPSSWKKSIYMYQSRLPLNKWLPDLKARLNYVQSWDIKGSKEMAIHDISKSHCQHTFFEGIVDILL